MLSVVELGVVRAAEVDGDRVTVTITPTYSGCPALDVMEREIREALSAAGYGEVIVKTVYAPAWTTDWIPAAAREKLRVYGIAPPGPVGTEPLIPLGPTVRTVTCPILRLSQHHSRKRVRPHRVQVPARLSFLPAALRALQGVLAEDCSGHFIS